MTAGLLGLGGCTAPARSPRPSAADLEDLLARRAAALLAGDPVGAAAVYAPADRERVRRVDARAVAAGLVEWAAEEVRVGTGAAEVAVRSRIAGEGRAVRSSVRTGWARDGGGWSLVLLEGGTPQPWDLGDVRAEVVDGGVVLHPPGSLPPAPGPRGSGVGSGGGSADAAAVARDAADDLAAATARVDGTWGSDWPRGTAVVVVATSARAAQLAGLDPAAAGAFDALAVGQDARLADGAPAGVRVVVAADRAGRLTRPGRALTLTHELVHVATRATATARPAAAGERPLPRWLGEGYADHVARLGSPLPATDLAAALLAATRAGRPPAVPADGDFERTGDELQVAYAAAWTLVTSAARHAGTPAVTALHRSLSRAEADGGAPDGPVAARLDGACRRHLGTGLAELVTTWRSEVAAGLVGWGP